MRKNLGKRGQLAIFIILALAILIVLVLIFINRESFPTILSKESPIDRFKECVDEYSREGLNLIAMQGGSVDPKNFILYNGTKAEYLCYTEEYYKRCVMQKPLLKQSVETELENYLLEKSGECIEAVKSSLEKKDYTVSSKTPVINVEIIPGNVLIDLELDLQITKDSTESYKSIKTNLDSKMYELVMIASSITNWEAKYGDSESMMYMMYYPDLKVEKKERSDGSTVYRLTDRDTGEVFMFASRSMALPPGITGQ